MSLGVYMYNSPLDTQKHIRCSASVDKTHKG